MGGHAVIIGFDLHAGQEKADTPPPPPPPPPPPMIPGFVIISRSTVDMRYETGLAADPALAPEATAAWGLQIIINGQESGAGDELKGHTYRRW